MCAFRKILGRHLTDFGVALRVLCGLCPSSPHSLLCRYPRVASLSKPLYGPKGSIRRLYQNPRPHEGAIQCFLSPPRPKTRTGAASRFPETQSDRPVSVKRWVLSRCSLEGGMHMHMFFACPKLTPPSLRDPCSATSVELRVLIVMTNAAKGAGHGKALFSSAREAIGILK